MNDFGDVFTILCFILQAIKTPKCARMKGKSSKSHEKKPQLSIDAPLMIEDSPTKASSSHTMSVMTLFYINRVITDIDLFLFQRMPRKVTTFGKQKKRKSTLVMTLFYIARVITDLDLEFFQENAWKSYNFWTKK